MRRGVKLGRCGSKRGDTVGKGKVEEEGKEKGGRKQELEGK